jgi:hypothetical protein
VDRFFTFLGEVMNIIELAKKAGIEQYEFGFMDITKAELDKFAALVAAHEREACAELMFRLDLYGEEGKAAEAIRARGNT